MHWTKIAFLLIKKLLKLTLFSVLLNLFYFFFVKIMKHTYEYTWEDIFFQLYMLRVASRGNFHGNKSSQTRPLRLRFSKRLIWIRLNKLWTRTTHATDEMDRETHTTIELQVSHQVSSDAHAACFYSLLLLLLSITRLFFLH